MRIRNTSSWIKTCVGVEVMKSDAYILRNELLNDGCSIYLYFSRMYEEYVAYGYSAFVAVENCLPMEMSTEGALPLSEGALEGRSGGSSSDGVLEGRFERASEGALRSMVLEESYSDNFQMPMVKVNRDQLALLRTKGLVLEDSSADESYLHIQSFIPFDESKYEEWAGHLRDMNH